MRPIPMSASAQEVVACSPCDGKRRDGHLQAYDPSVAAHYWDWTDGDALAVFNSKFYGDASESAAEGCALVNGPFQNWTIPFVKDVPTWTEPWIRANSSARARLRSPYTKLIFSVLGRRPGLDLPWLGRPGSLEEIHSV